MLHDVEFTRSGRIQQLWNLFHQYATPVSKGFGKSDSCDGKMTIEQLHKTLVAMKFYEVMWSNGVSNSENEMVQYLFSCMAQKKTHAHWADFRRVMLALTVNQKNRRKPSPPRDSHEPESQANTRVPTPTVSPAKLAKEQSDHGRILQNEPILHPGKEDMSKKKPTSGDNYVLQHQSNINTGQVKEILKYIHTHPIEEIKPVPKVRRSSAPRQLVSMTNSSSISRRVSATTAGAATNKRAPSPSPTTRARTPTKAGESRRQSTNPSPMPFPLEAPTPTPTPQIDGELRKALKQAANIKSTAQKAPYKGGQSQTAEPTNDYHNPSPYAPVSYHNNWAGARTNKRDTEEMNNNTPVYARGSPPHPQNQRWGTTHSVTPSPQKSSEGAMADALKAMLGIPKEGLRFGGETAVNRSEYEFIMNERRVEREVHRTTYAPNATTSPTITDGSSSSPGVENPDVFYRVQTMLNEVVMAASNEENSSPTPQTQIRNEPQQIQSPPNYDQSRVSNQTPSYDGHYDRNDSQSRHIQLPQQHSQIPSHQVHSLHSGAQPFPISLHALRSYEANQSQSHYSRSGIGPGKEFEGPSTPDPPLSVPYGHGNERSPPSFNIEERDERSETLHQFVQDSRHNDRHPPSVLQSFAVNQAHTSVPQPSTHEPKPHGLNTQPRTGVPHQNGSQNENKEIPHTALQHVQTQRLPTPLPQPLYKSSHESYPITEGQYQFSNAPSESSASPLPSQHEQFQYYQQDMQVSQDHSKHRATENLKQHETSSPVCRQLNMHENSILNAAQDTASRSSPPPAMSVNDWQKKLWQAAQDAFTNPPQVLGSVYTGNIQERQQTTQRAVPYSEDYRYIGDDSSTKSSPPRDAHRPPPQSPEIKFTKASVTNRRVEQAREEPVSAPPVGTQAYTHKMQSPNSKVPSHEIHTSPLPAYPQSHGTSYPRINSNNSPSERELPRDVMETFSKVETYARVPADIADELLKHHNHHPSVSSRSYDFDTTTVTDSSGKYPSRGSVMFYVDRKDDDYELTSSSEVKLQEMKFREEEERILKHQVDELERAIEEQQEKVRLEAEYLQQQYGHLAQSDPELKNALSDIGRALHAVSNLTNDSVSGKSSHSFRQQPTIGGNYQPPTNPYASTIPRRTMHYVYNEISC